MSCPAMRERCGDRRHYGDSEEFLTCVSTFHALPPSYANKLLAGRPPDDTSASPFRDPLPIVGDP